MMREIGIALLVIVLSARPAQVCSHQQSFTSRSEIAEFLLAAGLKNARLMSDAQRAEILPYAHHAWTMGEVIGAFGEYARRGHSLRHVLAMEIANISQACDGRILSGSQPPKFIGNVTLVRFAMSCDTVDGTIIVNGTLVQGRMSGAFIEHAAKAAYSDEVRRADDLVAARIEELYRHD